MTDKEAKRTARPDLEVKPPVQRRTFSKTEKLRILEEADACTEPGEIEALVRREEIYTSFLRCDALSPKFTSRGLLNHARRTL